MNYVNDGARVRAYCGAVGTGKTEALVRECADLLGAGVPAGDICVFATSESAARALAGRIAKACPAGAEVRVTTPAAWALEALSAPEAVAFTGREAHVLNAYEQDFFFEDMRVGGTKQHRLREMLKFFYRGWSEMRDDEDDWLVTVEEKTVHELARESLAMVRAYHPCELVAACVRYLSSSCSLAQLRVPHVLADDFRAMSRASQRLCALLAVSSLSVAWGEGASLAGEEPYGYAEGLDELAQQCDLERVDLTAFFGAPCAYQALSNLYKQECVCGELPGEGCGRGAQDVEVAMVGMLGQEAASVVSKVHEALEAGVAPEDVFVAAGRSSWAGRMQAALAEAGVPVSRVQGCTRLPGDIRDPEKCGDIAMLVALDLVADPGSSLAWRCWCGLGDYLCLSAAFSSLSHALVTMPEVKLVDLLLGVAGEGELAMEGELLDQGRLVARFKAGQAMLAEAQGLEGKALLEALRKHACPQGRPTPAFDALVERAGRAAGAADLAALAARALEPQAPAPGCVRVGDLDALIGQSPRVLVLCGLVNGLYPERGYFDLLQKSIDDQAKLHAKLIAQLVEVCGKAGQRLVLSGFTHADILDSEPMKLMGERIRLRAGRRVCEFAPSAVVDYITGAKTAYVR